MSNQVRVTVRHDTANWPHGWEDQTVNPWLAFVTDNDNPVIDLLRDLVDVWNDSTVSETRMFTLSTEEPLPSSEWLIEEEASRFRADLGFDSQQEETDYRLQYEWEYGVLIDAPLVVLGAIFYKRLSEWAGL